MKISKRAADLLFAPTVGLCMSAAMSFVLTAYNLGFGADFAVQWLTSFGISFLVALPISAFLVPRILKFYGRITENPSAANEGKRVSDNNREILEIGQRAYDRFVGAIETGAIDEFAELMAEDVRFFVALPFEEWRGEQRGRERVKELIRFERETMKLQIAFEQIGITATNNLAAIEFRVTGSNKGGAFSNHLAIFFNIENGLVKSWREYVGDVNPKAVAAVGS